MTKTNSETIARFTLEWRVQHILLALSIIGLAFTGLAYRYYDTTAGHFLIELEGGWGMRGILHRMFALILGITALWHSGRILFSRLAHEDFLALMPERGDGSRWWRTVKSKFTGDGYEAEWGKYTFGQKVQYWMVSSGVVAMILTGLILLFGHRSIAFLPKWLVDTVRVVHGGQGVELMVFIVLWHLYSTHLAPGRFPMDHSWITGKITREQLKKLHRREYKKLFEGESKDA